MKQRKFELDYKVVLLRSAVFILMLFAGLTIISWLIKNGTIGQKQYNGYLLALAFLSSLCSNLKRRENNDLIIRISASLVSYIIVLLMGLLLFDGKIDRAGLTGAIIIFGGIVAAVINPRGSKKRKKK